MYALCTTHDGFEILVEEEKKEIFLTIGIEDPRNFDPTEGHCNESLKHITY